MTHIEVQHIENELFGPAEDSSAVGAAEPGSLVHFGEGAHVPDQTATTEGHFVEQTQSTDLPAEQEPWNHQKAETIGAALATQEAFQDSINAAQATREEVADGSYYEKEKSRRKTNLDVSDYTYWHTNYNPEESRKEFFEADASYRELLQNPAGAAQEHIATATQEVHESADRIMTPLETLYDVAPKRFAQMPTSEFMELGRELIDIEDRLAHVSEREGQIQDYVTALQERIEKRQNLSGTRDTERLMQSLAELGNLQEAEQEDMRESLEHILGNTFDHSERDVIEAYIAAFEKLKPALQEQRQDLEQRRSAFLDQFRPQQS